MCRRTHPMPRRCNDTAGRVAVHTQLRRCLAFPELAEGACQGGGAGKGGGGETRKSGASTVALILCCRSDAVNRCRAVNMLVTLHARLLPSFSYNASEFAHSVMLSAVCVLAEHIHEWPRTGVCNVDNAVRAYVKSRCALRWPGDYLAPETGFAVSIHTQCAFSGASRLPGMHAVNTPQVLRPLARPPRLRPPAIDAGPVPAAASTLRVPGTVCGGHTNTLVAKVGRCGRPREERLSGMGHRPMDTALDRRAGAQAAYCGPVWCCWNPFTLASQPDPYMRRRFASPTCGTQQTR